VGKNLPNPPYSALICPDLFGFSYFFAKTGWISSTCEGRVSGRENFGQQLPAPPHNNYIYFLMFQVDG
jgi:hypothetical protein